MAAAAVALVALPASGASAADVCTPQVNAAMPFETKVAAAQSSVDQAKQIASTVKNPSTGADIEETILKASTSIDQTASTKQRLQVAGATDLTGATAIGQIADANGFTKAFQIAMKDAASK